MSTAVERLIGIAEAEIGYEAKRINDKDELYKKAGDYISTKGSMKYTKYALELDDIDFYNGKKNGYDWCDIFSDWCYYQLCGGNTAGDDDALKQAARKKAQQLTCQPARSGGAVVSYSRNYYKAAGRLFDEPCPGDQIFFYNDAGTGIAHTGIVYKVGDTSVYTIEGNTFNNKQVSYGGLVWKHIYRLDNPKIAGYGRPRFDEVSLVENTFSIYFDELCATKTKISVAYDKELTCDFEYALKNRLTGKNYDAVKAVSEEKTHLTGDDVYKTKTFTISGLTPGTLYLLKITSSDEYTSYTKQVTFTTLYAYPDSIKNLSVLFSSGELLEGRTCTVSFNIPADAWPTTGKYKGYRVSLIINGKIEATSDTLIRYSTADRVNSTFSLSELLAARSIEVQYNDIIQIGIQTWIKDSKNNMFLSQDGPICSKPLYLKHVLDYVDKIYLKTTNGHMRSLLHIANLNPLK